MNQIFVDGVRQFFCDAHRLAVCILQIFPQEQLRLNLARPVGQNLRKASLQRFHILAKRKIRNDRQLVELLHLSAEYALVHAFALLVDAQAQAAPNFLPAANVRIALLFQCADLKHVRIVPALAERRVGENEPNRLVHAEQPLFVLHDEVVRLSIVGKLRLAIHLALHKARFLALFLVNGKITLMRPVRVDFAQIVHVRIIAKFALQIADDVFIFFFKHLRVLAVASRIIVAVIAAVFGNLVNEKQAQNLDPARVQFPLPLDVGADRFADLDTPLKRHQLFVAADLPGINFQAVQERD